jgi:hypothetical protein
VNPASGVGRAARLSGAAAERLGAGASVQIHAGSSREESAELLGAVAGVCPACIAELPVSTTCVPHALPVLVPPGWEPHT